MLSNPFSSSKNVKGLTNFIADLRQCQTKEAEEARVDAELRKVRLKFSQEANKLSGYERKKCVWKLSYITLLGYEVGFGHREVQQLMTSQKYGEKRAGYIGASLLLFGYDEMLSSLCNVLITDLRSQNESFMALALHLVSNCGTQEMADHLFSDIQKIANPEAGLPPYLRRKGYMAMLRLFQRRNSIFDSRVWANRLAQVMLRETHAGCLTSLCALVVGVIEVTGAEEWSALVPAAIKTTLRISGGDVEEEARYYSVSAPWLQIKLLRLMQFFPPPKDSLGSNLSELIGKMLVKYGTPLPVPQQSSKSRSSQTKAKQTKEHQKAMNKANTEHAILFEVINLVIHCRVMVSLEIRQHAATVLNMFLETADPNTKFLVIETLSRLATDSQTLPLISKHVAEILHLLQSEIDPSIRRQTLSLLYQICDRDNWQRIVSGLVGALSSSDEVLQEELTLKIALVLEKNAPDLNEYVEVIFQTMEKAPNAISDDIWYRAVQVVTGFDSSSDSSGLQKFAAQLSFDYLADPYAHEIVVRLGAYILGEFGYMILDEAPSQKQMKVLRQHLSRVDEPTQGIIIVSLTKLFNTNDNAELHENVLFQLKAMRESISLDLQQRAIELYQLCRSTDPEVMDHVLQTMPTFSEEIQNNNPLIKRAKLLGVGGRAVSRTVLDQRARSASEREVIVATAKPLTPRTQTGGRSESGSGSSSDDSGSVSASGSDSSGSGPSSSESDSEDDDHGPRRQSGTSTRSGTGTGTQKKKYMSIPLPEVPDSDVMGLWKNLCVSKSGRWYTSPALVISLTSEWTRDRGRLTVKYSNRSPKAVVHLARPDVPPFAGVHAIVGPFQGANAQGGVSLKHNESLTHRIDVKCIQPFISPPRLNVKAVIAPSQGVSQRQQPVPVNLPLSLPVTILRFVSPAVMGDDKFQFHWPKLSLASEARVTGELQAHLQGVEHLTQLLQFAFNLHPLQIGSALCGAGTLHTGAPTMPGSAPASLAVAIMTRIDLEPSRRLVRLTVRTSHLLSVSEAVRAVMSAYMIVKSETGGGTPRQGSQPSSSSPITPAYPQQAGQGSVR
eukprot:GHVN01107231.1.p1 GENE.GHVN01107231.1~~GHVN01107231.1.p1  ORF type:complete len:1065 (+),score=180.79 GHVN01107231.1:107-3301(+)